MPRARTRFLAALLLLLLGGTCFVNAGTFLVVHDPFTHAEAALVLSGDEVRRSLAASDLYREGRVDRILVIPEPPDPTDHELIRLGLRDPHLPPWPERILVASGVPPSRIEWLPEPANGTIMEAREVQRVLRGKLPKRLVIITSKFASRRARLIFRAVLGREGVDVLSYPNPYDAFEPRRWWAQPRNALYVVMEYQKLVVNLLTLMRGAGVPR